MVLLYVGMALLGEGGPETNGRRFWLRNHGKYVREVNESEFHLYQARQVRLFSGHYLGFRVTPSAVVHLRRSRVTAEWTAWRVPERRAGRWEVPRQVEEWGIEALHRAIERLSCRTTVHICYGYGIKANISDRLHPARLLHREVGWRVVADPGRGLPCLS